MKLRELYDQELDELIGVKKYQHLTAKQIMKKMEDELGLKKLGHGAFGIVLQSPDPNWVYKVIEKDPAYEEYIDFITENPNNHYPKIKRVKKMTSFFKRYQLQEDKFTVIVIEKLEPIPKEKQKFIVDLANEDVDDIPEYTPDGDTNDSRFTLEEIMSHNWGEWTAENLWGAYYAALTLRRSELRRDSETYIDLHAGNIMQRKDGTIVIIDPIASYKGIEYGSSIATAKMAHEPMIKGPHYKKELARAGSDDDPYNDWNPHAPLMPASDDPQWGKENPSQWNDRSKQSSKNVDRAFAELEELEGMSNLNAEQVARMNQLRSYINRYG